MRYATFPVLALTILALAACDDDDNPVQPAPQTVMVRLVNASPTTAGFDLVSDGQVIASNVAFRSSTACLPLTAGSNTFTLRSPGSTTGSLLSIPSTFLDSTNYTIVVTGPAAALQAMVLPDTFTAPETGRARIRFINTVSGLAPQDIFVTAPTTTLDSTVVPAATEIGPNGTAIFTNFLDVPAGQTEVRFANSGTNTVSIDTDAFTLAGTQPQTIIATEAPGGGTPFGFFTVNGC